MKALMLLLVGLLLLLQYELWIDPYGLRQTFRLQQHLVQLNSQNQKLQQRNQILIADIQDLKKGHQAIESRARNEMGMVRHGEQFYQIVN